MAYRIIRPATHEEWLRAREEGIGSSEATSLMGVNHFEDRYRLFMRKTHRIPPKESSELMELGHHMEPAVASRFAQLSGAWVDPKSEGDWIAVDTKRPYLRVSPDRIWIPEGEEHIKENWRILECKTTSMAVDSQSIPSYWYCQLQYQMGVMGIKHGAVAWISSFPVLNSGFVEIDFNPSYFKLIVDAVDDFWLNNIQKDVAPEPEALEDLREEYSKKKVEVKGESLVAENWLEEDYEELLEIKEKTAILSDRKKELEEQIEKAIMGYGAIYCKDGETVIATRQCEVPKPSLDLERLAAELPETHRKYLELQEAVFNEKLFKKECKDLYGQYTVTGEPGDPVFRMNYPRRKPTRRAEAAF